MSNINFARSGATKTANLWPGLHALLDEGALYLMSSTNASATKAAGTAIATTTSVVDDAATAGATNAQARPVMFLANTGTLGDEHAPSIYPIALKMTVGQAPTSATVWSYAIRCDSAARYTSGGTLMVGQNLNMAAPNASVALCYFGAVVTGLPNVATSRVVGNGQVQSTIPVTKDVWIFTFGDSGMAGSILTASAAKNINIPAMPFMLAPGWNMTLEMWGGSNAAAPSWEFEFLYAERTTGQ
jgi:hypothetical protein